MKNLLLVLSLVLASMANTQTVSAQTLPHLVAHRGAWFDTEIPENTIASIEMAKRYGYQAVEVDVQYTSDSVMVIMHDRTINRTMRNASDYSEISTPVNVSEITYKQLRNDYVIASTNPELRTPAPTLAELLTACKEYKIVPMLHSLVYESYELAQEMMGDAWVCFNTDDELARAARQISDCLILIDAGQDTTGALERLQAIGGKCGISTMRKEFLTDGFCENLRAHGFEVQSSIFPAPHEAQAVANGISILLTDFSLTGTTLTPTDRWTRTDFDITDENLLLAKDDVLEKEGDQVKYGGILLKIRFAGALEIEVNNDQIYPITQMNEDTAYISVRYHNDKPTIKITATEKTKIVDLETDIFEL